MELFLSFLVAGFILLICYGFGKGVERATRRLLGLDDTPYLDDR